MNDSCYQEQLLSGSIHVEPSEEPSEWTGTKHLHVGTHWCHPGRKSDRFRLYPFQLRVFLVNLELGQQNGIVNRVFHVSWKVFFGRWLLTFWGKWTGSDSTIILNCLHIAGIRRRNLMPFCPLRSHLSNPSFDFPCHRAKHAITRHSNNDDHQGDD